LTEEIKARGRGGEGRGRAPGRQAVVRMGDAVEALALEEVIQPAEVKQNHGGRLRNHPSRLPVTIFALSVFVFVVIRVWLSRNLAGGGEEASRQPVSYSYTSPIRGRIARVTAG